VASLRRRERRAPSGISSGYTGFSAKISPTCHVLFSAGLRMKKVKSFRIESE
jgi:hypothetical protein